MTTTTTHRAGGSRGGNQYGEYKVRYASEKQKMFIKTLLEQKQHNYNESELNLETLNVQGAKDLISNLLSLPLKQGYVPLPSEKQINFLKKLIVDKEQGLELFNSVLQAKQVNDIEQLSRQDVSALINTLVTYKVKEVPITVKEVGAYLYEGKIYSLRIGVESKKWQVWSLNDEGTKYVRNDSLKHLLHEIKPENRLTLEQAIKHSAQVGVCVHCGRTLTLLKSVAGGMGAVCAKRYH